MSVWFSQDQNSRSELGSLFSIRGPVPLFVEGDVYLCSDDRRCGWDFHNCTIYICCLVV